MNLTFKIAFVTGLIYLTSPSLKAQYFPEAGDLLFPLATDIDLQDDQQEEEQTIVQLAPAPVADFFIYSLDSGNWSNPAIWSCDCVPDGSVDVEILDVHEIIIDADVSVNSLAIQEQASLILEEDAEHTLELSGDWFNQGNFNAERGSVVFSSEIDQSILGETDFHHLSLYGNNDVALQNEVAVKGILDIQGRTLLTNGLLTMSSSIAEKAQIAPLYTGNIEGELTYLNVIYTPFTGWLNIGAPMINANISEWNDDFVTTGFTGSDYPNYSFVSIQRYNESSSTPEGSFLPVESVDEAIVPGEGYYVYVNPGTYYIDVTGTITAGDFEMPLSYTDHDLPSSDGLRLMSNPYPSKINWEDEDGWEQTNLYRAIYSWDVSTSQFRTYLNGYSVNGGSPIINPCQTFWVQANDNDPELHINEHAKAISSTPSINQSMNFVGLRITNGSSVDEMMVVFSEEGTPAFDLGLDALKLNSSSANINAGTKGEDGTLLAINTTNIGEGDFDIPISMDIANAGSYSLLIDELPISQSITACMVILDTETGNSYPMEEGLEIAFETEAVIEQERFVIQIGAALQVESSDISCFAAANGSAMIQGTGDGPWDYQLTDTQGNILEEALGIAGSMEFDELEQGVYRLHALNNDHCAALSKIVSIAEPDALEASVLGNHLECDQGLEGTLEVSVNGGVGPYSFTLNDEEVGSTITGLAPGVYDVLVSDAQQCTQTVSGEVTGSTGVNASFETESGIVYLENGEVTVEFTNTSENADNFVWEFGMDGETASSENGTYTFTAPGFYLITLYASNSDCDDSSQYMLVVEGSSAVNEGVDELNFTAQLHAGQLEITVDNYTKPLDFQVRNTSGQLILEDQVEGFNYQGALNISPGVYFLGVRTETGWMVKKILGS
jgi:hypothetical protein